VENSILTENFSSTAKGFGRYILKGIPKG